MEKLAWMNLLYDFYGQLLTNRQQNFVQLYYADDLSLGEIAQQAGVSRQAVYDTIKRAQQVLTEYEEKLNLAEKYMAQREKLMQVLDLLPQSGGHQGCQRARDILTELINSI